MKISLNTVNIRLHSRKGQLYKDVELKRLCFQQVGSIIFEYWDNVVICVFSY